MSIRDEEGPPVRMPPVMRDPSIGFRREAYEAAAAVAVDEDGNTRSPRAQQAWRRGYRIGGVFGETAARAVQAVLLVLVLSALGVLVLSALGLLAHGAWDAIMFGWRIAR